MAATLHRALAGVGTCCSGMKGRIMIIRGEAVCEVAGKRYRLGDCGTAFVPKGWPHWFLNESKELMAMIGV